MKGRSKALIIHRGHDTTSENSDSTKIIKMNKLL